MDSSTPNAEKHTLEDAIYQSIEESSESGETLDPQTPDDEPDRNGEDNLDAEENPSDEKDADDEEATASAVARRFERSRAPSPEDLPVRNGYGGRDRGASSSPPESAPYVSPPRSAIATGARLVPSPSPHTTGIPPRDPSANADGPPCDSYPDMGSESGRTDD